MSRHGYSDELDGAQLNVYRGVIASATRGKRGQAFFRALVAALDAMPEKKLIAHELENKEGAVCALGCLGKARGLALGSVDMEQDAEQIGQDLGKLFDIAPQLAHEVMYVNDEWWSANPEDRWHKVRKWAAQQIVPTEEELAP